MTANQATTRKNPLTRHNVMLDPATVKAAKKRKLNISELCRKGMEAALNQEKP
jgi:post-segregation antitoxin (ccd killing protein)